MEENIIVSDRDGNENRGPRKSRRKLFWGIVLVTGAVAMLMNRLGYLGGVGFWQMVFTVILAAVFLNGILRRSFSQMMLSLAVFVIVNDEMLHMEAITPVPVLVAAVAISIGLKMLFPNFSRHGRDGVFHTFWWSPAHKSRQISSERREGDVITYENTFGSAVKYITEEVSVVYLKNNFGGMEVFFNDAVLKGGSARVRVESSFGGMELYVPASWDVKLNVDTGFGAAEENGIRKPADGNVLYIDGEIWFGGLEVHYI